MYCELCNSLYYVARLMRRIIHVLKTYFLDFSHFTIKASSVTSLFVCGKKTQKNQLRPLTALANQSTIFRGKYYNNK